ncbi:hypothetical protein SAMN04488514_11816 [Kriegella aquimaris]|uniref:Uncharacterized protein n=1 Tax=Kriegella aquimaris TaxID=192904 RepID=A0A1G9XIS1_9FLAO|nr:hypothetical protein SAMN04488514_11816 [Kriegella aquimaris]
MNIILRIKTYQLGFNFYKKYLWASLLITTFLIFFNTTLLVLLFVKLALSKFLFFAYYETSLAQKLVFYKNFGISKSSLFIIFFVIDSLFSTLIFLIMELF